MDNLRVRDAADRLESSAVPDRVSCVAQRSKGQMPANTPLEPTAYGCGGAVGGGCAFRFDGRLPPYGRVLAAVAVPLYRALGLASGCFLFCTREAFRVAGGFDETLFGAEEAAMSRALRRQGRFVILRESVTTSGRKLRAYSGREVLGILLRLTLAGPKGLRRRDRLDIWYGERRADPETDV